MGENSSLAMIEFVLDQCADVFTVVVLAAFSRRERTAMPFPGMPAVISKVQEPYGPKPPLMIADSVCVRCREVPGDFSRIPQHHDQPAETVDHGDTPITIDRSRLFFADAERRFGDLRPTAQVGTPRSALSGESVSLRNAPILITTTAASPSAASVALSPVGLSGTFFSSISHTAM